MPTDHIISLTTEGFAAVVQDLLGRPAPLKKVILLAWDPGMVATHIFQREGYQVHIGPSQEVVAAAIAARPDLIVIEPKLLEQLLRAGGTHP